MVPGDFLNLYLDRTKAPLTVNSPHTVVCYWVSQEEVEESGGNAGRGADGAAVSCLPACAAAKNGSTPPAGSDSSLRRTKAGVLTSG